MKLGFNIIIQLLILMIKYGDIGRFGIIDDYKVQGIVVIFKDRLKECDQFQN